MKELEKHSKGIYDTYKVCKYREQKPYNIINNDYFCIQPKNEKPCWLKGLSISHEEMMDCSLEEYIIYLDNIMRGVKKK